MLENKIPHLELYSLIIILAFMFNRSLLFAFIMNFPSVSNLIRFVDSRSKETLSFYFKLKFNELARKGPQKFKFYFRLDF